MKELNKAEAFSTGGGFYHAWLWTDEHHYYDIDNECPNELAYFDDSEDDNEWGEICMHLIYSKDVSELNAEERSIYHKLYAELAKADPTIPNIF